MLKDRGKTIVQSVRRYCESNSKGFLSFFLSYSFLCFWAVLGFLFVVCVCVYGVLRRATACKLPAVRRSPCEVPVPT
jgi:hypothetical protein